MKLYILYLNEEIIEYQLTYFNYKAMIDEVIELINLDLIESIKNYKIKKKINESEHLFTFRDIGTYLELHTNLKNFYYNYVTTINKTSNQLLVKFNEQNIYEETLTLVNYKEKINEMFNETDLINLIENYSIVILDCNFTFNRNFNELLLIPQLNNNFYISTSDIQNIKFIVAIQEIQLNITNYEKIIKNIFIICCILNQIFIYDEKYKFCFVYDDDNIGHIKLTNIDDLTTENVFTNKEITINILDMVLSFKVFEEFEDTIAQQFSIPLTLNNFQQTLQNYIGYLF
jgi:hypothetical protein